jgi:hypothetical protein
MVISGAPVFFAHIDKEIMNSVIMQIELEHSTDGESGKTALKFTDHKLIDFYQSHVYFSLLGEVTIPKSFIEHFKRYVSPYYPSVPTPPPNHC